MTAEPSFAGTPTSPLDHVLVLGLGTAIAYGALAHGGFYRGEGLMVLLLVVAAAAARMLLRRPSPAFALVSAAALLALAIWSIGLGLHHGSPLAALPAAALACVLAAAVWCTAGLDVSGRNVLQAVVLASGVVVAFAGWLGVTLHIEPFALESAGLWRANSTLTYTNATASFLVMTLVLAVAVLPPNRRRLSLLTVFALLLGLVATMSRGGLFTLVLAVLVLLTSGRYRARLWSLWPVLPATAVAVIGLLLAATAGAGPQLLPALAGLGAGLTILLLDRRAALAAATVALGGAVLVASDSRLEGILSSRLTLTPSGRDDFAYATAAQFLTSPLTGVGPGRLDLVYVDDRNGLLMRAHYTHNEYLQIAAETGAVGLALALMALGALALAAIRRWRTAAGPPALVLVTAFAVHSAFDFLWHIPVLPLLLVVCAVPLMSQQPRRKHEYKQGRHQGGSRTRRGHDIGSVRRGRQRARPARPGAVVQPS